MHSANHNHNVQMDNSEGCTPRADRLVTVPIEAPNPDVGRTKTASNFDRARRWAKSQKPAIRGADRDQKMAEVADGLIGGHALSREDARPIFAEYNQRCLPPITVPGLEQMLEDAMEKADVSPSTAGWLLLENESHSADSDSDSDPLWLIIKNRAELWHTPDMRPFATVQVDADGADENFEIDADDFGLWLSGVSLKCFGNIPTERQLNAAIHMARSLAKLEGPTHEAFVRIAGKDERIYVDLCDKERRVVEIDINGVRTLNRSPVKFLRPAGMLEMPIPDENGRIDELRDFIPVASDADFMLVVAFLAMCFNPNGPYAGLSLTGQQGTGKSTSCRTCAKLVNPCKALLQSMPKDLRDLAIAAAESAIVAVDNVSYISSEMSDALCQLATGNAFRTRKLYHDTKQTVIEYCRPLILNGIGDIATRADLLDRCILIELQEIPASKRKREKKFWKDFDAVHPRLLGALFRGVSAALRNASSIPDDDLPRMADFAQWGMAAAPAFGWQPEAFLAAYKDNIAKAVTIALDQYPVVSFLQIFAVENSKWRGTATELLLELNNAAAGSNARTSKNWPSSATTLSNLLTRLGPALAAIGIGIEKGREKKDELRYRYIEITFNPPSAVPMKLTTGGREDAGSAMDGSRLLTY